MAAQRPNKKIIFALRSAIPDTEPLLESIGFPASMTCQKAFFEAGIPLPAFSVDDVQKEFERMKKLGVKFSGKPAKVGPATDAVFDDTCGNLVQSYQV